MLVILFASCNPPVDINLEPENPFSEEFDTEFNVPPFDKIMIEHYLPAFQEGMRIQNVEIDRIVNMNRKATFKNTIEVLDDSGVLLTDVSSIFYSMTSQNTSPDLQELAKELAPLLSKHGDDISLNADLFKKVKSIYDKKDKLKLDTEQKTLLKEYYTDFVRGGANLNEEQQVKFRKINGELSVLTLQFGDNILNEDRKSVV